MHGVSRRSGESRRLKKGGKEDIGQGATPSRGQATAKAL
jgi:hypothetical protein